jgi:sulfur carrier protein ThiS
MSLHVFLNSSLLRHMPDYDPDVGIRLLDSAGKTAHDVLAQLGIEPKEIAIATVNQSRVSPDHVLQEKDEVIFFPLLSGG